MEARVPPPVMVAGPSRVWCRRSRKVGVADIFMGVSVRELQHLFRSSGDEEAEQRAQVVWGRGDPAELTQALMALRSRRRRNRSSRHTLSSRWLRAFGHLRINESSTSQDDQEDTETEVQAHYSGDRADTHSHTHTQTHSDIDTSGGREAGGVGTEESHAEGATQSHTHTLSSRVGLALHTLTHTHTHLALRRGEQNNPERYLHRIIH